MQRGYSLIELLVVLATAMVLTAIAIPMMQDALVRANVSSLATDSKAIEIAFKQYYMDHNQYPGVTSPGSLDFSTSSFDPLVSLGYYSGRVGTRLVDGKADGYGSPDDQGSNQEYWLEMTLAVDTSIRFLVADSDDAPLAGGDYYHGIFLFLDGQLRPIGNIHD